MVIIIIITDYLTLLASYHLTFTNIFLGPMTRVLRDWGLSGLTEQRFQPLPWAAPEIFKVPSSYEPDRICYYFIIKISILKCERIMIFVVTV